MKQVKTVMTALLVFAAVGATFAFRTKGSKFLYRPDSSGNCTVQTFFIEPAASGTSVPYDTQLNTNGCSISGPIQATAD